VTSAKHEVRVETANYAALLVPADSEQIRSSIIAKCEAQNQDGISDPPSIISSGCLIDKSRQTNTLATWGRVRGCI